MEPNTPEPIQKEKLGWLKMIVFFIFGTSGIITTIIAGVWIFFRTKVRKRQKYSAVAAGLIFSIVGGFAMQQFIFYKAPETKEIKVALNDVVPPGRIGFGLSTNKTITSQGSNTTNSLTINHVSKNWLTASETQKVGVTACEIIEKSGKEYDVVQVTSNKSVTYPITFYQATLTAGYPCSLWSSQETSDQLEQLHNMMNMF